MAPGADRADDMWSFEAIGTRWQIETDEPLPTEAQREVRAVIDRFDAEWSRFRPDSLVSQLARGAGWVSAPADADTLLAVYADLSAATSGAVNPLIGDVLERRGYDSAYSFVDHGPVAAAKNWQEQVRATDGRLVLDPPATIDVGAIGKGRLVDLVLACVRRHVGGDIVVDASGDLVARGTAVRVALEHPYDTTRAVGVIELEDAALCASAVNRRVWGDGLHHVLDARTGAPVQRFAATWAVASDALHADAIATALFFDGGPELAHVWGADWVRMTTDGRLQWAPGSKAELFT